MERKVLVLLGLLQYFLLAAFAQSDFSGNSIYNDMANIEQYAAKLQLLPTTGAFAPDEKQQENSLLPFGALKTDWARMQLLRDALPPESILKTKFKHVLNFLFFAYDQANRFANEFTNDSTVERKTTESMSTEQEGNMKNINKERPMSEQKEMLLNPTVESKKVGLNEESTAVAMNSYYENVSTLESTLSDITTPKQNEYLVQDSVLTQKNSSTERDNNPDLPVTETSTNIKLLTTIYDSAAPTVIFRFNNLSSDSPSDSKYIQQDSPINETTPNTLITAQPQVESTFAPDEKIITNSTDRNVINSTISTDLPISLFNKNVASNAAEENSTSFLPTEKYVEEKNDQINITSSIETSSTKKISIQSSAGREYFPTKTVATPDEIRDLGWTETSTGAVLEKEISALTTADEFPLTATIASTIFENESSPSSTDAMTSAFTTNPEQQNSIHKEYSLFSTAKVPYLLDNERLSTKEEIPSAQLATTTTTTTTTTKEQFLPSTKQDEALRVELSNTTTTTAAASFVDTSEKSKQLSISTTIREEDSLTQSTTSATSEAKSEPVSSTIKNEGFSIRSKQVYSDDNEWSTIDSIEQTSTSRFIAKLEDTNEGVELVSRDNRTEFPTSERSTGSEQDPSDATNAQENVAGPRKTTAKPSYVKNALKSGSSRTNHIFREFKHGSSGIAAADEEENRADSKQIILYESGGQAKAGSVWRPHIVREQPAGNNIWRFDTFPKSVRPYLFEASKAPKFRVDSESEVAAKRPSHLQNRANSLRWKKRGSANADIEKQFRWFYRQGKANSWIKSRSGEKNNTKISIECKNAQ